MKHDKYELTYKKFLKAEKRLNEIYKLQRQALKVQLREPYQNGWILTIVLRDDYARGDKGKIAARLLDLVVVDTIVKNPKYISQIRQKPTLSITRKILSDDFTRKYWYSPYLAIINQEKYDKLTPQEKKFFNLDSYESEKDRWGGKRNFYYLDIPQHYLVVKVTKRMITHARELDTQLQKEEAELKTLLEPYWRTCGRYSGDWYFYEKRAQKRMGKVDVKKLLNEEYGDN